MRWSLIIFPTLLAITSGDYLMGGHVDNRGASESPSDENESPLTLARTADLDDLDLDLEAEESTLTVSNDKESLRYHLPYPFPFSGGRPFSLEKDPITGKIDFDKAPTIRPFNYTDRYGETEDDDDEIAKVEEVSADDGIPLRKNIDGKDTVDVSPNEINPYSPNFHDFLNLPVHYSSDKYGKDKYPLISSSYANTKVQSGSNSYSMYNHKPYHEETILYYPTRKPYVPRTTPTTTTTRTMRPSTTSTTTPSTTIATTTTTTTTTRTTLRPTTVSVSTKAPIVTTWKPPTTSTRRYPEHLDDYEDILPIEKLQASMYTSDHRGPNNVPQQHRDPPTRPPVKNEEYIDEYEEYEMNDEEEGKDYSFMREPTNDFFKSSPMPSTSSVIPNTTTSTTTTEATTTMAPTTTMSSTVSMPSSSMMPQENPFIGNPLQFQGLPNRPVTSMPLDNDYRVPPTFENVVDNRRVGTAENALINSAYRPTQTINQRPNGLGGGILVESTSNIVVPPDQDTVSFILGNRQNVEGGYYSLGTAIGESPYGGSTGIDGSFRPLYGTGVDQSVHDSSSDHRGTIALPSVTMVESNPPSYGAQAWQQPRPSSTQKLPNEIEPTRTQSSFVKGTVLMESEDDRKNEKDVNYVVFPKDETKHPVEEHIVIVNEADGTIREIPPSSTTMKPRPEPTMPEESGLPQLSENLTPPAERPKPPSPFYYHYHHGGTARPDYPRPQRLPLPARGKQPPLPPLPPPSEPLGIRRRPYSPEPNLPNILPQFRPNAKTSHGHRSPETIGTIPAGQSYPTRIRQPPQPHPPSRRPLSPPPSYLQRLNPPPPPIHALRIAGAGSPKTDGPVPPREPESTHRFRLPPTSREDEKPIQPNRISSQKLRLEDEERYSEEPPQLPPRPPLFPKRRTADSPLVATLQMIQQHGEFEEDSTESNSNSLPVNANSLSLNANTLGLNGNEESTKIVTEQEADRRKYDNREAMAEPPVYVVYPVNTAVNIHPDDSREKDESVVVGTHGPHRPLPPETLLQDNDDHEMENERPSMHGLFNGRPIASDFPYPLERPDPSILINGMRETPLLVPNDQRQEEIPSNDEKDEKDSSVNVIPYLQDFVPFPVKKSEVISATLHRLPSSPSSTPIAYVYTPTAQASHRLDTDIRDEEISKIDRNDEKPVLLPSQQASSSSSSAPSPQNFMAPFIASISAEAPSKNGWSVVMMEPTADRKSDEDLEKLENAPDVEDTQTEKNDFDAENFKPQLFGGFKPIYTIHSEDLDEAESREVGEKDADGPTRLQDGKASV